MAEILSEAEFRERLESLRGKQFPVLSEGYVMLVDAMGGDRRVVEAARTTSDVQGKTEAEDVNLLRYLMRHRHSTPGEFGVLCFKVRCPYDCWRQWIRHRTFSVNEFSSRYSEVPDRNDVTPSDKWRLQSQSNRQGSSDDYVVEFPVVNGGAVYTTHETRPDENAGDYLSRVESLLHSQARQVYEERLRFGVAKEQARKDLCLSTYTEAYWQGNLHNLLHFLSLRMDKHAQLEIRSYANAIGEQIVSQLFPATWEAFVDYRLSAMTLTRLDQGVIAALAAKYFVKGPWTEEMFLDCQADRWKGIMRCRERDECFEKLCRIGLVSVKT